MQFLFLRFSRIHCILFGSVRFHSFSPCPTSVLRLPSDPPSTCSSLAQPLEGLLLPCKNTYIMRFPPLGNKVGCQCNFRNSLLFPLLLLLLCTPTTTTLLLAVLIRMIGAIAKGNKSKKFINSNKADGRQQHRQQLQMQVRTHLESNWIRPCAWFESSLRGQWNTSFYGKHPSISERIGICCIFDVCSYHRAFAVRCYHSLAGCQRGEGRYRGVQPSIICDKA